MPDETSSLYSIIHQTLATERIGSPVFVRCIAHLPTENIRASLAEMLFTAQLWFNTEPLRIYIQGEADVNQMTASVLYEKGQTALLTLTAIPPTGRPGIDLMLIGNEGAIYHDELMAGQDSLTLMADEPVPAGLLEAIEGSIRTGQAVSIENRR